MATSNNSNKAIETRLTKMVDEIMAENTIPFSDLFKDDVLINGTWFRILR
jgi:hypothetical protein